MFREDYIVRMIEQATAFVARVLGLKEAKQYAQAFAELDAASQQFWGLNLGLLNQLAVPDLLQMAQLGPTLDVGKLLVLAELERAEGDVHLAQGHTAEGRDRYLRALEILLAAALGANTADRAAFKPRIDALVQCLGDSDLPADLRDALADFNEQLDGGSRA